MLFYFYKPLILQHTDNKTTSHNQSIIRCRTGGETHFHSISFWALIEMPDGRLQHSCFDLAFTIPLSRAFSHAHAYVHVSTAVSFFAVTSVTPPPHKSLIYSQTTRRFQQNNTSFSIKQHVVFYKTTRYFHQNNTLLFRPNEANRPSKNSRTLNYM